jgi:hypothetical protein
MAHLGYVKKRTASTAPSRQKKIRDSVEQAAFPRPNKRNQHRMGVETI